MKNLNKFKQYALNINSLNNILGGSHLENCLASIDGACSASCGSDDSCYGGCVMNQTNQCYAILGD